MAAMSSGLPNRPTGVLVKASPRTTGSLIRDLVIAVSITPGRIRLTRMRQTPSSEARDLASIRTPDFDAA